MLDVSTEHKHQVTTEQKQESRTNPPKNEVIGVFRGWAVISNTSVIMEGENKKNQLLLCWEFKITEMFSHTTPHCMKQEMSLEQNIVRKYWKCKWNKKWKDTFGSSRNKSSNSKHFREGIFMKVWASNILQSSPLWSRFPPQKLWCQRPGGSNLTLKKLNLAQS